MKEKMNNKGFSLVELIIVIAIMAVLIVVAAPQYMKYVERGRNSTDRNNAAAIESAMMVWASETETGTNGFAAGTIVVTVNATSCSADVQTGAFGAAMTNAGLNPANITCQSRTAWTSFTVTVTIAADGTVTVVSSI